jgi:hypothetical protein
MAVAVNKNLPVKVFSFTFITLSPHGPARTGTDRFSDRYFPFVFNSIPLIPLLKRFLIGKSGLGR